MPAVPSAGQVLAAAGILDAYSADHTHEFAKNSEVGSVREI